MEQQFLTILFLMLGSENTKYSGLFMYMTVALSVQIHACTSNCKNRNVWTIQMDKQSHHTLAEYTVILCPQSPASHTISFVPSVSGQGEGLLSALSLGHQAAIVASATDLRVRGQGGRGGGRQDRGSVG